MGRYFIAKFLKKYIYIFSCAVEVNRVNIIHRLTHLKCIVPRKLLNLISNLGVILPD